MFYKPCKEYEYCANADKLCCSCKRNAICQDNFLSKPITDDNIFYPKYSNHTSNKE